eukprot:GHRR01033532.1.p1 GENE.GHRR01033532.1~~GHRR01033532.1.p1  ORF type:complete len:151 (+),score=22.59 GHRR01033532.1:188-640(+)
MPRDAARLPMLTSPSQQRSVVFDSAISLHALFELVMYLLAAVVAVIACRASSFFPGSPAKRPARSIFAGYKLLSQGLLSGGGAGSAALHRLAWPLAWSGRGSDAKRMINALSASLRSNFKPLSVCFLVLSAGLPHGRSQCSCVQDSCCSH